MPEAKKQDPNSGDAPATSETNRVNFYSQEDPKLMDEMKEVLIKYSGIPSSELIPHVKAIREDLWKVFQYPTIGFYGFANLRAFDMPPYAAVIERLKNGETLLDLGCCVGNEIRKMTFDGAPSENLAGADLQQEYIDAGYKMFNDKSTLRSRFFAGDFFDDKTMDIGDEKFDMIMPIHFFHLFSLDEQVFALTKTVRLLKRKPGSIIFARQFGSENPQPYEHSTGRSGIVYPHSPETWKELVAKVAKETGTKLETDARFIGEPIGWFAPDARWLEFCITMN